MQMIEAYKGDKTIVTTTKMFNAIYKDQGFSLEKPVAARLTRAQEAPPVLPEETGSVPEWDGHPEDPGDPGESGEDGIKEDEPAAAPVEPDTPPETPPEPTAPEPAPTPTEKPKGSKK